METTKRTMIIGLLATATAAWAGNLQAVVVCDDGEKAVEVTMTLNTTANDLFPIVRWNANSMEEEIIAPGGMGALSEVITEWVVDDSSSGQNVLDIPSLMYTYNDTNAIFVDDIGDGRYEVEYCLPDSVNAVTIHALFRGEVELRGIESTVGHVMMEQGAYYIDAVANRHTATWFKNFREGKQRSGAEVLLNIMESHHGTRAPRSLTSLQVIALNEMYSLVPAAGQLRATGQGVDVEGTTIFVESNQNWLCFSPRVSEFWVTDVFALDPDNCVTDLHDGFWDPTTTRTDGYYQHGVIIDARALVEQDLTDAVTMGICNGNDATVSIGYNVTPWNFLTTLSQNDGALVWEVEGNETEQEVPCEETDVLLQVFGNTRQPLYEVSGTISPPLVK
jgi:hypothetical protein